VKPINPWPMIMMLLVIVFLIYWVLYR